MALEKKISITVVVNGQLTVVDIDIADPLGAIISFALRQTRKLGPTARKLGAS